MPTYDCGCINEVDAPSGVLKNISKCEFHRQWSKDHPQGESIEYFKEIGCIDEKGIPQNWRLVQELNDALSFKDYEYLLHGEDKIIAEFGPGLGPYIPFFLARAWTYYSYERSKFAWDWIINTFYVPVSRHNIENIWGSKVFHPHCIFAAHLFEHLPDAPAALRQAYEHLTERLYLIVPDDGDPTNPDHLWFFTQPTLHNLLKKIGFRNVRSKIKKRVPQENFIYCVAEK